MSHYAQPTGITLTGIDAGTPLTELMGFAAASSVPVEFGFLYTATPEGRMRYPDRATLERLLLRHRGAAALHVCGNIARAQLAQGELGELVGHVQRIQVNGTLTAGQVDDLCLRYSGHTIITQHTIANADLVHVNASNHALLVDGSGGRGITPGQWVRPITDKAVGFAGGLGPHTLAAQLPRIARAARGAFWIDMEQSLRSADDAFDSDRAQQVIAALAQFAAPAVPERLRA